MDFSAQSGEGNGCNVTPSALYETGDWTADAALRFSQTDYEQVLLGTAGTAEAQGTALRVSLSRAFDLGNEGRLSPVASIVTGREEITGTGGGLAGAGSREYAFTETSLGAVYAHEVGFGTASIGVFADNLDMSGDAGIVVIGPDRAGASGRIELGFETALSDIANISAGISYGGPGSDMEVVQAALGVSFRF